MFPTPEDDELEATIGQLFSRMENARQLVGLRKSSEIACLIFEEFNMRGIGIDD